MYSAVHCSTTLVIVVCRTEGASEYVSVERGRALMSDSNTTDLSVLAVRHVSSLLYWTCNCTSSGSGSGSSSSSSSSGSSSSGSSGSSSSSSSSGVVVVVSDSHVSTGGY